MIGLVWEMPPGERDAVCGRGAMRVMPRWLARPASDRRGAWSRGHRLTLERGVTSIAFHRGQGPRVAYGSGEVVIG